MSRFVDLHLWILSYIALLLTLIFLVLIFK